MKIRLDLIRPSPRPVRSSWDEEKMEGLAQSIKEQGLIVPVKVRPIGDGYELVYGHRRVEAARRADLEEIEAIVEGVDDRTALIQALIENVQREDLSHLDEGRGYIGLQGLGIGTTEIARRTGKHPDHVKRLKALARDPVAPVFYEGDEHRHLTGSGDIGLKAQALRGALGNDLKARELVAHKSVREGLSATQTRRVAETIAKTKDPKRREFLLQTPYSSYSFDPDYAEEAERQWHQGKPAIDKAWQEAPEITMVLLRIRKWREERKTSREAVRLGKLAPEGKPFLVKKLQVFVAELQAWIKELEA